MSRKKNPISDPALCLIESIGQRLTDLLNCDIPKRLHSIEEKMGNNQKPISIEHVDRFYSEAKTVLTATEASEYIGVTESYLYKLTSARRIPHYKPTGKLIFFDRCELDDWLHRNRRNVSPLEDTDENEKTHE